MKSTIIKILKEKAIWMVFIILFVAFSLANPRFLSSSNLFTIARQVSMLGIASIGMTFVILISGIDLSTGSIITFVNIVAAFLMVNMGFGMVTAIILSLILSILVGVLNGCLISTIGIPAIIATFATQIVFEGASYLISGGTPIYGFDERFKVIGQGYLGPVPVPVIIMIVCFAIGSFILNKSYFGRYFYAVGGNEEASKLSGIRVGVTKYLVYALSGLFAGLAGIVMLSRTNSAQPTAGLGYEFDVITCVVLGGVSITGGYGKMSNVIAGVLIIGILTNGMVLMNVSTYMQMVVKGIVLVLAVGFDSLQKKRALT
ncbi:monosaccharide ABC transporter membrane protein (CUT2 family) [Kineothrix alysoides]|uniref:Monosaccharide ABC transporter membrane protein (CUT2 family) n=1 Tax=Kineothrix alysoides TaxID=1469948 RepID=A0A4R1R5X3_9FIRM|nr:ABC transporter permease [Kineothrix alysoides]TCL60933.1 monosaccharide ABC transporter membrane protein (CUT2 family) [Kineothrix alysoides]